jgi:hypothetical protein
MIVEREAALWAASSRSGPVCGLPGRARGFGALPHGFRFFPYQNRLYLFYPPRTPMDTGGRGYDPGGAVVKRRPSMNKLLVIILLLLWPGIILGEQPENDFDFSNYKDMRAHFGNLYNEGKYAEGAELLEWALKRFPDNLMANAYNLTLVCGKLDNFERGVEVLHYALENGVWFGKYAFNHELWNGYRDLDKFKEFEARNAEMMLEERKKCTSKMLVVTPDGYKKDKKYPLFIALHGGGENMTNFKEVWKSETLEKEFVTLYVQSSQIIAMNGFNWTEDLEITKKEITDAYNDLMGKYDIDRGEIIIGGFSSGGVAALEVTLCNTLPVTGFVVLCPAKPERPAQKEMEEIMKKTGIEHRFLVTPDIGHWIPDDLNVKIDDSITHIRKKS